MIKALRWNRIHCDEPGCDAHEDYAYETQVGELPKGWTAERQDPFNIISVFKHYCPKHDRNKEQP